jgi:hypothetical protein
VDSGWKPVPLTDLITSAAVKKAYKKATLCVHPDKLQQRGATIRQKYICEKVFDLLKVCAYPHFFYGYLKLHSVSDCISRNCFSSWGRAVHRTLAICCLNFLANLEFT